MHLITIFTVTATLYVLLCTPANAAPDINSCFKKDENKSAISICLASLQYDLDIKRKRMENDLIVMIEEGLYGSSPGEEQDSTTTAIHGTGRDPLEHNKHHQKNKEERTYHFKRQLMAKQVNETAKIFEQYREMECERHAQAYNKQETPFLADFAKTTCEYMMTQQRMKILERSLK